MTPLETARRELERAERALAYSRENELIADDAKRSAMLEWNRQQYANKLAAIELANKEMPHD